ncbi:MAG: DUF4402 domain-containing protein, partial [Mariniphaga sp.]|nr:DUF4402 domain-containing protein [Mariniphaga sp.]
GQNAQDAEANAAANIISPMAITKNVDLNFGNIAAGTSAGTVELGTDGERTETNVILPSVTGTVTAAEFTVTGLTGSTYAITLPTTVTITSGANNMTIDNFTNNATNTLTAGTETFNVGATLNVKAEQAVGLYQGTFDVTVDYQ